MTRTEGEAPKPDTKESRNTESFILSIKVDIKESRKNKSSILSVKVDHNDTKESRIKE